jgi:Kef-type K+ transport system membrane component KefB
MAIETIVQAFLFELGAIIIIATLLGIVAKKLRQPVILAYIVAGIIVGPVFLNLVSSVDTVYVFSHLGVAFLLFLVGLNMNYKVLREVGKISLITGLSQIIITFIVGYGIATVLGFTVVESSLISIALTFSSTIIIVKLLADKNDIDSLYGKISVGFLLVQDFVAIAILVLLSGNMIGMPLESLFMVNVMKIVFLFCVTFVFGKYLLPPIIGTISKSTEILFLSGISWMFLMSMLSMYLGFSIEIGALLAGISMASLPYHFEITGRVKPLRDFFLILFFVTLGAQMIFSEIGALIFPAILFSVFILIGNPLIVMTIMGIFGYKKRTGFLAGLTVAQISEFSLVLVAIGMAMGFLSSSIVSMVTMVGLVTIAVSSYMISYNGVLYNKMSGYLSIFERKNLKEKISSATKDAYNIVIIGYHRMGYTILKDFGHKSGILVVDFNPTIIDDVKRSGIACEYGDISDPEVMDRILTLNPKLIISTVPSYDDSMYIINKVKDSGQKIMVFLTTNSVSDALEFYNGGADYVIVPHFLGGEKAAMLLDEFAKKDLKDIKIEKDDHIKNLRRYAKMGQKHI